MSSPNELVVRPDDYAGIALAAYNKALAEGKEDAVEINKRLPGGNVPTGTPIKDWRIDQITKIVV